MRYPKLRDEVRVGGIIFNLRVAIVLWLTTIVTLTFHYHSNFLWSWLRPYGLESCVRGALGQAHNRLILYFLVPVAAIWLMGDSPLDYGLRIGRWKEGLLWLVIVCPLLFVVLLFVVPGGRLDATYRYQYFDSPFDSFHSPIVQLKMIYTTGVLLWSWEYLLRGFCLFGLARIIGPGSAIFVQMVPFALLHSGKAEVETMTTWLSGVGFGFVAWRTQSFLYAFLIHWFMLVMTITIALGVFA